MKVDKQKAREDFDDFIFKMDDQIEALQEEAAASHIDLDMSEGDFERLESLFDKMSAGVSDDKKIDLIISFARYLGELVRKLYGGKWALPLDDEKNINFNKPVIVGHSRVQGLEFAPITTMRAYALRKRPGTVRQAVMSHVRPQPLDLSDLIEE